jgi:hypothetical protein
MTFSMAVDDRLRAMYTGETDEQIQERLDEMVGWVAYHAPCTARTEFDGTGPAAQVVRSLIRRAMKYEKATDDGVILSRGAGPFNQTVDNRRPTSPTPFAPDQQAILKSLCASQYVPAGAVSVRLGPPSYRGRAYTETQPEVPVTSPGGASGGSQSADGEFDPDLDNIEDLATLVRNRLI